MKYYAFLPVGTRYLTEKEVDEWCLAVAAHRAHLRDSHHTGWTQWMNSIEKRAALNNGQLESFLDKILGKATIT